MQNPKKPGRPYKGDAPREKINYRIPGALKAKIVAEAERLGTDRTAIVERAIEWYFAHHQSA